MSCQPRSSTTTQRCGATRTPSRTERSACSSCVTRERAKQNFYVWSAALLVLALVMATTQGRAPCGATSHNGNHRASATATLPTTSTTATTVKARSALQDSKKVKARGEASTEDTRGEAIPAASSQEANATTATTRDHSHGNVLRTMATCAPHKTETARAEPRPCAIPPAQSATQAVIARISATTTRVGTPTPRLPDRRCSLR